MESFITAAIIGTDQSGDAALATNTKIDDLTSQLTEGEKERRLLLAAGAWGAYTQAGRVAQAAPQLPETAPAEAEGWQPLPRTHTLETLLIQKEKLLLPEAFALMLEWRYYIPYDFLPLVLDYATGDKAIADSVFPVLGERGRWLSHFNPRWHWAEERGTSASSLTSEQLEALWQEGEFVQRLDALTYKRQMEPALARQWLEQVWKQERAETRINFLEVLNINLSADDEAFLEKALDDRSERIREIAASLLSHVPNSAYMERLYARTQELLEYQEDTLTVNLPGKLDKAWVRDGLISKTEVTYPNRIAASRSILFHIPVAYWEQRFHLPPSKLVASVKDDTWRERLFAVWAKAAIHQKHNDWALDLLTYWNQEPSSTEHQEMLEAGQSLIQYLFTICSQEEAEEFIQNSLRKKLYHTLTHVEYLPRPWSHDFSLFFLQWAKNIVPTFANASDSNDPSYNALTAFWEDFFPRVALALAPSSFASAAQGWVIPELPEKYHYSVYYHHQRVENNINRFLELLQYRKNLLEEIG